MTYGPMDGNQFHWLSDLGKQVPIEQVFLSHIMPATCTLSMVVVIAKRVTETVIMSLGQLQLCHVYCSSVYVSTKCHPSFDSHSRASEPRKMPENQMSLTI